MNLETSDITPKKAITKRNTNPLEPNYDIPSKSGRRIIQIGPIEKNSPKVHGDTARQANQKEILVARRAELDATLASAREKLGDASLSGRASLLKSLVTKAEGMATGKMVLRPTKIDKAALEDAGKSFKMGTQVDGLGGFILEAEDGTLSFDFRLDTLLENAWNDQRAAVNQKQQYSSMMILQQ